MCHGRAQQEAVARCERVDLLDGGDHRVQAAHRLKHCLGSSGRAAREFESDDFFTPRLRYLGLCIGKACEQGFERLLTILWGADADYRHRLPLTETQHRIVDDDHVRLGHLQLVAQLRLGVVGSEWNQYAATQIGCQNGGEHAHAVVADQHHPWALLTREGLHGGGKAQYLALQFLVAGALDHLAIA